MSAGRSEVHAIPTRKAIVVAAAVVFAAIALTGVPAAADATVTSCGRLIAYEAPTDARPIGQVRINEAGQERVFQVTGTGTVSPPDIAAIGTALNPVIAQLQGTPRSDGVLTSFSLTHVTSCSAAASALPSTSTDATSNPGLPIPIVAALAAIGLLLLVVLLLPAQQPSPRS